MKKKYLIYVSIVFYVLVLIFALVSLYKVVENLGENEIEKMKGDFENLATGLLPILIFFAITFLGLLRGSGVLEDEKYKRAFSFMMLLLTAILISAPIWQNINF